MCDTNL